VVLLCSVSVGYRIVSWQKGSRDHWLSEQNHMSADVDYETLLSLSLELSLSFFYYFIITTDSSLPKGLLGSTLSHHGQCEGHQLSSKLS
jgi:hypothetical protein